MRQSWHCGLVALAFAAACGGSKASPAAGGATGGATPATVYTGGDILTMVGDAPQYAEALVVKDGRIAFVGSKAEADQAAGGSAAQVDLAGRTMLPGFNDTHGHVMLHTHNLDKLDLANTPSIAEVQAKLKAYIAERKPEAGEWILAFQSPAPYRLAEQRQIAGADLDAVSTDIAIFVQESSGHFATVNSAALKALGWSKATEDPVGGRIYRDPKTGAPDGRVDEAAVIATMQRFPPMKPDRAARFIRQTLDLWAQHGFTTARDQLTGVNADDFAIARMVADSGWSKIDVRLYADAHRAEEARATLADMEQAYVGRVRLAGVKLMMDGVPTSWTSFLRHPYATGPDGRTDYHGVPNMPAEDVRKYVDMYYPTGLQLNAHVMGDSAIAIYLGALEATIAKHGRGDRRPVAQHSGLLGRDLLPRYAATGTTASFNSDAVSLMGPEIVRLFGKARTGDVMPARRLLDATIPMTINTDCPAGPSAPTVFNDVVSLVTRKHRRSDFVADASERITMYEGLVAITRTAAWVNFEERTKGTLEIGKLADLVILDHNPLKVDPEAARGITVLETIKEGTTVYRAN